MFDHFLLRLIVLLAIAASGATAGAMAGAIAAESSFCAREAPDAVIQCYQRAHEDRDLEAVGDLLADDFSCVYIDFPETGCPSKADALAGLKGIWDAPPDEIRRFELSIGGDPVLRPAEKRDTWVIEGIQSHLVVDAVSGTSANGPYVLNQLLTWHVRLTRDPEPHYVIFREEIRQLPAD